MHKSNELELGLERLEERKMLAGDVSLEFDGGDVEIRGDNNTDQAVAIEATDTGFLVTGIDTTINGQTSVEIGEITGDLEINLRSGDNLLILTASGEDSFAVGGDVEIDSGRDSDVIILDFLDVGGELDINTRGGDDAISLKSSIVDDDFDLRTGGGNDVFTVFGNDNEFGQNSSDDFDIRTGSGVDGVIISRSIVHAEANIRAGGGEDRVSLFESTFNDEIDVSGGGRDDTYLEDAARPNIFNGDPLDLSSIEFEDTSSFGPEFTFQVNDNDTFSDLRDLLIFFGIG